MPENAKKPQKTPNNIHVITATLNAATTKYNRHLLTAKYKMMTNDDN